MGGMTMSEPMWLQGDTIALSNPSYAVQEVECSYCGHLQEIDTEEEFSHGETTWYGEWTCTKCNEFHISEGWY